MAKALSAVGYLAMAGGLVGLIFFRKLFSASPFVLAPQAAAVSLMLWARVTFGRRSFHAVANPTEGGLVTTGPYRFVRHPIYTAVCLFVLPGVVAHGSLVAVLLGMLKDAGSSLSRIPAICGRNTADDTVCLLTGRRLAHIRNAQTRCSQSMAEYLSIHSRTRRRTVSVRSG